VLNFRQKDRQQKIFNDENFPICGTSENEGVQPPSFQMGQGVV
jgi:hypothetical protein